MFKKLKLFFYFIVFWIILFIGWEWWNSYPKVRILPSPKASSVDPGADSILNNALNSYLLPGLAVSVVKNGKTTYMNAVGFENLENKDSLKLDSKILVASVSKLFTALAVAEVFQEHKFLAGTSLGDILKKSHEVPNSLENLNLSDLLSHQSGISDKGFAQQLFSLSKTNTLTQWGDDFVQNAIGEHFDNKDFQYADANFDFLGYLLSKIENLEFDSIMDQRIFASSGMLDTEFIRDWPLDSISLTGYQRTFLWKRIEPKRIKFPILPSPSSGMLTTTRDMGKALIHLLRNDMGIYQDDILWLTDSSDQKLLGFQYITIDGLTWLGHYGGQAGYSSMFFYSHSAEMGIFIFANSKDESNFRIKIATELINYFSN